MDSANIIIDSSKDALGAVTNMSLDTIILLTLFVALFAYGLKYGKRRIISLLISFYISIPIISSFPYMGKLLFFGETEKAILYAQVAVFLVIIVILNIIINRVISWELGERGLRKLIEIGALALASGGLLAVISYHIIPITALYDFAPQVDALFASTTMFFWWLIIPLGVLLFTIRR